MSITLTDIENRVAQLAPQELSKFRQWFVEFDNQNWDKQIENDIHSGKLDELADQAILMHKLGKTNQVIP